MGAPLKRFTAKYVVNSDTGCWDWIAGSHGDYGVFKIVKSGKLIEQRAHRAAYLLFKGEIPNGLMVCHSCDNPKCVNPDHLWLGTNADNMADMAKKGRSSRKGRPFRGGWQKPKGTGKGKNPNQSGEDNHQAVLNNRLVEEIRHVIATENPTLKVLALRYGVSVSTIHRVKHRLSWK